MRHRKREFKVGRRPDHVRSMLANQVCSLIFEGRIKTTVTKAKETKRLVEKMVTLAKSGTLHDRRRAIARIKQVDAVRKLFSEIAPNYMDRQGGYTRIIRLGTRRGDGADICYLEFVEAELKKKKSKKKPKKEEEAAPAEEAEVVEEAPAEETEAAAEEAPAEDEAPAEAEASADEEAPAEEDASEEEEKKDE